MLSRTAGWSRAQRRRNAVWHAVVRGALAVFARVPRRVAGAVGAVLGTLAWVAAPRLRRIAAANVVHLHRADGSAIARRSFAALGRAALEVVSGIGRPAALLASVRMDEADRSRLDDACAAGRGVIFLSAHLGAWELLAWAMAAAGRRVTVTARESYDPRFTRMIRRLRRERGVGVVFRGERAGAKRILRALRGGGLVGILLDQDTRVPGVFVPFLGKPAWTARGAAELALRTGAEVVCGACVQGGDGWQIVVRRVPVTRRGVDDVRENTARFSLAVEALVRSWPEQWIWLHERWRSAPAEKPGDQAQSAFAHAP